MTYNAKSASKVILRRNKLYLLTNKSLIHCLWHTPLSLTRTRGNEAGAPSQYGRSYYGEINWYLLTNKSLIHCLTHTPLSLTRTRGNEAEWNKKVKNVKEQNSGCRRSIQSFILTISRRNRRNITYCSWYSVKGGPSFLHLSPVSHWEVI